MNHNRTSAPANYAALNFEVDDDFYKILKQSPKEYEHFSYMGNDCAHTGLIDVDALPTYVPSSMV